jgi:hypothetical protein
MTTGAGDLGGRGMMCFGKRASEFSVGEQAMFPPRWPVSPPAFFLRSDKFMLILLYLGLEFDDTYVKRNRSCVSLVRLD